MTNEEQQHVAIDLGAESGRVIVGSVHPGNGSIDLKEVHRFPNNSTREKDGSMVWHLDTLFRDCVDGLQAVAEMGITPASIGVDSWGVDYVLLDRDGEWLLPAHHYRDSRTARGVERALEHMPWEDIFAETGIQFMPLNTLFQVMAESPEKLSRTSTILGIGDAIGSRLGGRPVYEVSMASTTQFYNPAERTWSAKVMQAMKIPESIFPEIVPSGEITGRLSDNLCERFGWTGNPPAIVATCTHDTGAAVAAVPASGRDWAYLSSGTWSLMGVETENPIITDESRKLNFTNEVGYGHSIRLLKNISGMWLIQECRREWEAQGPAPAYDKIAELAAAEKPFRSLINPSSSLFLAPESMTAAMQDFCRRTDQPVPESKGQLARCAFDSLALLYAKTLQELESLTGIPRKCLHIVGGGSKNRLLNQLAANACDLEVVAGPVEATALGNIMIQSMAFTGESLQDTRQRIGKAFQVESFSPEPHSVSPEVFGQFDRIIVNNS